MFRWSTQRSYSWILSMMLKSGCVAKSSLLCFSLLLLLNQSNAKRKTLTLNSENCYTNWSLSWFFIHCCRILNFNYWLLVGLLASLTTQWVCNNLQEIIIIIVSVLLLKLRKQFLTCKIESTYWYMWSILPAVIMHEHKWLWH